MKPTRRDAVKSVVALAAGLFAGPTPAAPPTNDETIRRMEKEHEALRRIEEEEEYDRDEAEDRGRRGGERRRRQDEAIRRLLQCWWEVEDATDAALEAHECDDRCKEGFDHEGWCNWSEDLDGIGHLAARFTTVLECELNVNYEGVAAAERERRREAFRQGAHCGCPVLWGRRALKQAKSELWDVVKQLADDADCWVASEARRCLWAAGWMEGVYWGQYGPYLSPAAEEADRRDRRV